MRDLSIRWIIVSTVVALIAAVTVFVALDGGDDRADDPAPAPTATLTPAPGAVDDDELAFVDFEDREVLLSELEGTPVVINFFASWCVPCRTEMPAFEAVHQDLGDEVTFVGIAYNDQPDDAQETIEETGITYRAGRDLDGALLEHFEGIKMPTTVLLDADGNVVHREDGELDEDELRALLADKVGVK
jgi:cytochrome c biogenesis protein CcmG/thiol:disulfide interchange protein DsbE